MDIQPLSPERWRDLEALFGANGACGGCWCRYWQQTAREFAAGKGEANRRRLAAQVRRHEVPGLIAYQDGQAVGWIAVEPRAAYPRLARSRVLAPVDDTAVWSAPCFFVRRGWRGRGLTCDLLDAACDHVRAHRGTVLEGYPVDTGGRRSADAFVYTGLASTFRQCDFHEVARRSPTRPVMRRVLP